MQNSLKMYENIDKMKKLSGAYYQPCSMVIWHLRKNVVKIPWASFEVAKDRLISWEFVKTRWNPKIWPQWPQKYTDLKSYKFKRNSLSPSWDYWGQEIIFEVTEAKFWIFLVIQVFISNYCLLEKNETCTQSVLIRNTAKSH